MSEQQQQRAEELVETFDFLDDWENRYEYLIEIGRALPPMPESDKVDANLVKGCQSQVWVTAEVGSDADKGRVININADSNSTITKGIVGILHKVYSGEKPADILTFDIDGLMSRLQLDQHLSPSRRNGLAGMVTRIKSLAAQNAKE